MTSCEIPNFLTCSHKIRWLTTHTYTQFFLVRRGKRHTHISPLYLTTPAQSHGHFVLSLWVTTNPRQVFCSSRLADLSGRARALDHHLFAFLARCWGEVGRRILVTNSKTFPSHYELVLFCTAPTQRNCPPLTPFCCPRLL